MPNMQDDIVTHEGGLLARYSSSGPTSGALREPSDPAHPHSRPLAPIRGDSSIDVLLATLFQPVARSAVDATLRSELENIVRFSDKWTSIGPWRVGYGDDNELTLLFTVKPGSMTPARAVEVVREARSVLHRSVGRLVMLLFGLHDRFW